MNLLRLVNRFGAINAALIPVFIDPDTGQVTRDTPLATRASRGRT